MSPAELSVIVGVQNATQNLEACLARIPENSGKVEVIVVFADDARGIEPIRGRWPGVLFLGAPGQLVPHLWGIGIGKSGAPLIALTTAQCTPEAEWIPAILANRQAALAGGIGGSIEAPGEGAALDWATLFTRYSSYLPPLAAGKVDEIAGDNAVYARDAIESCWTERGEGFWETLVHRAMRKRGLELRVVPEMVIRMGRVDALGPALRIRFRHGHHFGRTRSGSVVTRLIRFATAPLLAPLLALRILRRVCARRPDLKAPLMRSTLHVLLLLGAWTMGEAAGYLASPGHE